jgi:hypothetical protein
MIPHWMALLVCGMAVAFLVVIVLDCRKSAREAREDFERLSIQADGLKAKLWYRNIPARLDKWQQERSRTNG